MRAAPALILLLLAACASEPAPSSPEGQEHLGFEGVEPGMETELRELVAPDLKRYREQPRDTVLEDAVFRLEYRYRFEGYADVRVEIERKPEKVIFRIVPGRRVVVGRVHFEGNSVFSDEQLKALRPRGFLGEAVPYSSRLVVMLREQILTEYRRKGYVEADLDVVERRVAEDPGRVHVTFAIKEGRRFLLTGLEGAPEDPELDSKLEAYLFERYTPSTPEQVEATVIDHLRDHGRPFAQAIATPKVDRTTATVQLVLDVRPGPEAALGELKITGDRRTRDSFVRGRVTLEPGTRYRAADLRVAEERLQSTMLFRSVRVSPGALDEGTGRLPVEIQLEEKEAGEAAVRAGYGSHEGIRGGADLSYANLFGGAELLRLSGTASTLGARADAEIAFPYLLGTEFRPGVTSWFEDREFPSFDTRSYGMVFSLSYPLTDRLVTTAGVRYAIIETDNIEPGVPPGDLLDFNYTALFASVTFDLLDNPRLPTSGIRASAEVDWSPESFRSDVVFVSASGRVAAFVPLPLDMVLASSFQGGIIMPRGKTEEIPISLRYFAGGVSTVRGFKPDIIGPLVNGEPTGGEIYLAVQSELRFPIWGDFHGAVFSDQGGVWFDHNRVALDETRWSVGLGLRYYTAAGAFVLDVGWNPHRENGENPVEVHFSIGFPF